jgi:hypothetical protein
MATEGIEKVKKVLKQWRDNFESHKDVIRLENERLMGVSKMLASNCPSLGGKVYIYLLDPLRRAALIQRGAEPIRIPAKPNDIDIKEDELAETGGITEPEKAELPEIYRNVNYYYLRAREGKLEQRLFFITHPSEALPFFQGVWGAGRGTEKKAFRFMEKRIEEGMKKNPSRPDSPDSQEDDDLYLSLLGAWSPLENTLVEIALLGLRENDVKRITCDTQALGKNEIMGVLVPVDCWGQARAAWLYGTKEAPETIADIGPVLEALVLERFPLLCEGINQDDLCDSENREEGQLNRYKYLLACCASLWKPLRIFALDGEKNPLCVGAFKEEGIPCFDDVLAFGSGSEIALYDSDSRIVFSIGGTSPQDFKVFSIQPNLDKSEQSKFHEALYKLFPKLQYIVWDLEGKLENIAGIPNILKDSGSDISKSIVSGIIAMLDKKKMLDLVFSQGEEKKAKDILPDWSHAFGSYLFTIKSAALKSGNMALLNEVDSAATANEALTRWLALDDWRRKNPHKRLTEYISNPEKPGETGIGSDFLVYQGMKHLLAKLAFASGKYFSALQDHWLKGKTMVTISSFQEDAMNLVNNAHVCKPDIDNLFMKYEINFLIDTDAGTRLGHVLWPNNLKMPDSDKKISIGTLLQFLINELLFNAFKNAERIEGEKNTPFVYIQYENAAGIEDMGILTIANSRSRAKEAADEMGEKKDFQVSRGTELVGKLSELISGRDKHVMYGSKDISFVASAFIPHIRPGRGGR